MIGDIGEVIAIKILKKLYPRPHYSIHWRQRERGIYYKLLVGFSVMLRYNSNLTREARHDIASRFIVGEHEDGSVFYLHNAPDFIIESEREVIAVEVKTTIHKDFDIRGRARRDLQRQLEKYETCKDVTKIILLSISLSDFPEVRYSMKEIEKETKTR